MGGELYEGEGELYEGEGELYDKGVAWGISCMSVRGSCMRRRGRGSCVKYALTTCQPATILFWLEHCFTLFTTSERKLCCVVNDLFCFGALSER